MEKLVFNFAPENAPYMKGTSCCVIRRNCRVEPLDLAMQILRGHRSA